MYASASNRSPPEYSLLWVGVLAGLLHSPAKEHLEGKRGTSALGGQLKSILDQLAAMQTLQNLSTSLSIPCHQILLT